MQFNCKVKSGNHLPPPPFSGLSHLSSKILVPPPSGSIFGRSYSLPFNKRGGSNWKLFERKADKYCSILKSHHCNSKAHRVINLEMMYYSMMYYLVKNYAGNV